MCGIAGIVSYDAAPEADQLLAMTRALSHRGPDDEGLFLDGPVGLGFRRLSIIDLQGGHQPMSAGGATVVFNGEIYNFRELRRELEGKGFLFRTRSDTEVLLSGYLAWGEELVTRLDGMFAFALWDQPRQRLFAARDRFGKKPFYFAQVGRTFLFASELKALLAHRSCPRELDPVSLRRFLAFDYVPAPGSIFRGVRKLPAAHQLVLEGGQWRETRYWSYPPPERGRPGRWLLPGAVDEAAEELRERLRLAVRRRLVSDVPLGVFLSGGIDSSAVTALAVREVPRLRTFSVAFEESQQGEAGYDESRFARLAARTFGTEHSEGRLSAQECLDLIPLAANQLDEPFADPSYFPTFLLSRFARREVTVALGGDGADELFGGYDTFLAHPLGELYSALPRWLSRRLEAAAALLPQRAGYMSFDYRLRTFLSGAGYQSRYRHQAWIGSIAPRRLERLLTPDWRTQGDPTAEVYQPIDAFAAQHPETGMEWALRYYLSLYLGEDILVKVDRASMAASLEVRSPFLDTGLAELVLGLPLPLKVRLTRRKWLLKRALRGLVPDSILFRKKHGFAIPVSAWLRGPLRPLLEDLLGEQSLGQTGIFQPGEVRRMMEEHTAGRADHRKPLWAILMFELWRRRWAEAAHTPQERRSTA